MTDIAEPDRPDDATVVSDEGGVASDDATVEIERVEQASSPPDGAGADRPAPTAPLWMALALATIAIAALGVAIAAFDEARESRDALAAFRGEIIMSGEEAASTLTATAAGLTTLVDQPITFTARVDQDVPIVATVPFRRTIDVPISTMIPINEVIETTITVDGPFGFDVPVNVTVPLDLTIPIDLSVPLQIDEVIDVETSTRLNLAVPVELDLEESGLADLVTLMSSNLSRLAETIPTAR